MLLSSIRERYWPIGGKRTAKAVVRSCKLCFRIKPRTPQYLMGDLPKVRVTQCPPFYNCAIDYAGPFMLKDRATRGAKLVKGYICLFICLATKAIHLEAVSDLTTNCFIAALRRFISRRGKPLNIYSDNAKNFVHASSELREFTTFIKKESENICIYLSRENITWHFIPARSPTFGGVWEAGIKSVKYHLKRTMGNAHLTFEDFLTVLTQIEAIVNSRPLCPLTSDPENLNPLTPGHFLIGRSLTALPDAAYYENVPENRLKRYERLQNLTQHFWKRWHKEYLSELQTRVKWRYPNDDMKRIKVGTIVLVKEDNIPSMQWPMGMITELHPGQDSVVRVVSVKVKGKIVKRSVRKVCVFPENFEC